MDAEAEYNNRARVADHAAVMQGWARDSAAFRESWPHAALGLAYGPGEREKLDLFLPGPGEAHPLAMFMHGGYWQALDRSFASICARGLVARGVAVAVPSYDLCPAVPLARIVEQMREAAAFMHRRTGRRILAAGHSAGGQLAALLMATDFAARNPALPRDLVPAALPVSGVFELEPLLPTSIARALNLSPAEARALSPRFLPAPGGALHGVVGAEESGEFIRQTRDFATAWGGSWEALPGANHFTVLAPFAEPDHPLVARAAAMAKRLA